MLAGIALNLILALLAVVGSSLASCQLGGCRWINMGPLGGFQPAELLKLGLVLYLANLVGRYKEQGKHLYFVSFTPDSTGKPIN